MIENDFLILWQVGEAILRGLDPYAVSTNFYPPAIFPLYILFALLPVNVSYYLLSAVSAVLLVRTLMRKMTFKQTLPWFAFTPVVFIFLTGQINILFFALAANLSRKGWLAALSAALLTLKPQLALIVLPWTLLYWLRRDLQTLLKFIGSTLVIWIIPLFFSPDIYLRWYQKTSQEVENYSINSAGLFSLGYFAIPTLLLAVVALAIALYGLAHGRDGSLIANFLAAPFGRWYDTVMLAGTVPWQWMVPVSWVGLALAMLLQAAYPLVVIPAAAFLWMVLNRDKIRSASEPLGLPFRLFAREGSETTPG